MAITILILGGCARCEACIAAYNAHPSRSGYWLCDDCCGDVDGFATVTEFEAWNGAALPEVRP